ncbi:MAG: hypothetical protein WD872_03345 [Pirellulaceae bacterium]
MTDRRLSKRVIAFLLALAVSACWSRGGAGAEPRWPAERQAGPFLCHADFPLDGHQPLLAELAQLQEDLAATLGAKKSRETVHLFLFQEKGTYHGYLQQYFPKVPYRRALFIKARGPGMVFAYRGADFQIDVRHESTHALLHAWLPSVPLWLDEGLAEYFEVPHEQRAGQNLHLAAVRTQVRVGQLPRLEMLEQLENIDDMGRGEYRNSWAWIHFLLHGPRAANEELLGYLADLEAGGEVGPLSERLRRRLPDLDRRLTEHFR